MQRYWSGEPPYRRSDIAACIAFIDRKRAVWSPTSAGAGPGCRCDAECHGGMPFDDGTLASTVDLLADGFDASC